MKLITMYLVAVAVLVLGAPAAQARRLQQTPTFDEALQSAAGTRVSTLVSAVQVCVYVCGCDALHRSALILLHRDPTLLSSSCVVHFRDAAAHCTHRRLLHKLTHPVAGCHPPLPPPSSLPGNACPHTAGLWAQPAVRFGLYGFCPYQ